MTLSYDAGIPASPGAGHRSPGAPPFLASPAQPLPKPLHLPSLARVPFLRKGDSHPGLLLRVLQLLELGGGGGPLG